MKKYKFLPALAGPAGLIAGIAAARQPLLSPMPFEEFDNFQYQVFLIGIILLMVAPLLLLLATRRSSENGLIVSLSVITGASTLIGSIVWWRTLSRWHMSWKFSSLPFVVSGWYWKPHNLILFFLLAAVACLTTAWMVLRRRHATSSERRLFGFAAAAVSVTGVGISCLEAGFRFLVVQRMGGAGDVFPNPSPPILWHGPIFSCVVSSIGLAIWTSLDSDVLCEDTASVEDNRPHLTGRRLLELIVIVAGVDALCALGVEWMLTPNGDALIADLLAAQPGAAVWGATAILPGLLASGIAALAMGLLVEVSESIWTAIGLASLIAFHYRERLEHIIYSHEPNTNARVALTLLPCLVVLIVAPLVVKWRERRAGADGERGGARS